MHFSWTVGHPLRSLGFHCHFPCSSRPHTRLICCNSYNLQTSFRILASNRRILSSGTSGAKHHRMATCLLHPFHLLPHALLLPFSSTVFDPVTTTSMRVRGSMCWVKGIWARVSLEQIRSRYRLQPQQWLRGHCRYHSTRSIAHSPHVYSSRDLLEANAAINDQPAPLVQVREACAACAWGGIGVLWS